MNYHPLFSIVIPTRNRGRLLGHALRSALAQDFDDYEVVVVANDCQDNTRAVVSDLATSQVRYHETARMLTMPENWDYAWTMARGQYVIYLPDDDALVPPTLRLLAEHTLSGEPAVVSWEDAPYYYPDWHEPGMRNLLLLFDHGDVLVEDVPSERYRQECAEFRFAWSSPLPKLLNCAARRDQLNVWRERLGTLFFPVAPDYSFAWITSHVFPSIRVLHRPLSVRGISDHSIGSNAALGESGAAFFREFGDFDFFQGAPIGIPISLNHLAATFARASAGLAQHGIRPTPLDLPQFVLAAARQFKEAERVLPEWTSYVPDLLDTAERLAVREDVRAILTAQPTEQTPTESIRHVRRRTAAMAREYEPNLANTTARYQGDEQCARCVLGLEPGVLADSAWRAIYVFGEEIGASDPYAMSQHVDTLYDLLRRCRSEQTG